MLGWFPNLSHIFVCWFTYLVFGNYFQKDDFSFVSHMFITVQHFHNYLSVKILYCVIFVLFFLPLAFYQGDYAMRKNMRPFTDYWTEALKLGSETNTNSKRPEPPLWPSSQCKNLQRSSDQWNFCSGLSHSGHSGSPNPIFSYFPSLECISRRFILSNRQNSHTDGDRKSILYSSSLLYLPFWVAKLTYLV